jgi:hypothetical protein
MCDTNNIASDTHVVEKINKNLIRQIKQSRAKRKASLRKIQKQNKTKTGKKKTKIDGNKNWTREAEKIMVSWKQKTKGYSWMHNQAARFYDVLNTLVGLPILILSTLLSTNAISTFTMEPHSIPSWVNITISCITVCVTILSAIQTFFNFANHRSKHMSASKGFNALTRKIQNELVKARHNRTECYSFFELISGEYNQLLELDSGIPGFIARRYRTSMVKMLEDLKNSEVDTLCQSTHIDQPRPLHVPKQTKRKSVSMPEVNIPIAISDSSSNRSSLSGTDDQSKSSESSSSHLDVHTFASGSPPESFSIHIDDHKSVERKLSLREKMFGDHEFSSNPIHREDSYSFIEALRMLNKEK